MNNLFRTLLVCFFLSCPVLAYVKDTTADILINKNVQKPRQNLNYNYESTVSIPVKVKVVHKIKSDKDLHEGQTILFMLSEDVVYKNKIIVEKGYVVPARVETIIGNGMNGIPASIVFGDFKIRGIEQNKITQKYEQFGLDLSLFVFPLKWALTPLPPTGSLTNFILGGRAKLDPKKEITLYYYPEW